VCQKDGALNSDRGAGTVLVIAVIGLSVAVFGVGQIAAQNLSLQTRIQSIADAAALTADDALRGLITGYPCEVAKEIAIQNMANLVECRIVGLDAFIGVDAKGVGIVLNARARAGPSN
jgi:secretion/DNA translocation related TadE-like protein